MSGRNCVDVNEAISKTFDDVTQLPEVRAGFGLIYGLVWLLGVLFNGGAVVLVGRRRNLRSASNYFLLNLVSFAFGQIYGLVASDLLLCVTAVPVTPIAVIRKEWIFGAFLCRTIPLSQSWSVLITSWSLTAIALDKFLHIQDGTRAPVSRPAALCITAAIWVVSGAINIPYMLSYKLIAGEEYGTPNGSAPYCGSYCEELNWSSEGHRRAYGTSIMCLQFVIPMLIITVAYSRILAIVRRDMIVGDTTFSSSLTTEQRKDALRRKRKVTYILIAMVAAFIAAWFPLTLVNILRDFNLLPGFISSQPWLWTLVVHSIAMTTVLWNPILFFWLTRKGRSSGKLKRLGTQMREAFSSTGGTSTFHMPSGVSQRRKLSKAHSSPSKAPRPLAVGGSRLSEEAPLVEPPETPTSPPTLNGAVQRSVSSDEPMTKDCPHSNGRSEMEEWPRAESLPPEGSARPRLLYLRLGDSARC